MWNLWCIYLKCLDTFAENGSQIKGISLRRHQLPHSLMNLNSQPLQHEPEINTTKTHKAQTLQLMKGIPGQEVWGGPLWSGKLTCGVCRNIQDGLQQFHVFNVVDVNGLLQAHQQPLQSHTPISGSGRLEKRPTRPKSLLFPMSPTRFEVWRKKNLDDQAEDYVYVPARVCGYVYIHYHPPAQEQKTLDL